MYSIEAHQSPVKTPPAFSCKVKRRLFLEEEKGDGLAKVVDQNEIADSEADNSIEDTAIKVLDKDDSIVSSTKSAANLILIITTFDESTSNHGMQLLTDQATCIVQNANVLHCLPEHALRQCEQLRYNIIFTDINMAKNSDMLRLVVNIRKSNVLNQMTPIIALNQTVEKNVDLTHYGVSYVFRGEVNVSQIRDIFQRYREVFIDYDPAEIGDVKPQYDADTLLSHDPSAENHDKNADNQICDSTCEPAVCLESQEQEKTSSKGQFIVNTVQSQNLREDQPFQSATPTGSRILFQDEQGPFMENIRPMSFPALQLQRAVLNKINAMPPPFSLQPRRLPFPFPVAPQMIGGVTNGSEIPYMVSGLPGSTDMRLTMLSDPGSKHSTKERMRRERIKDCCESLRNMLPKPASCTRKIDMATVLELTVLYVKIFQNQSSTGVQEECAELFQSSFQQVLGKRQLPEDEKEPELKQKVKSQKKESAQYMDRSISPKRNSMLFQPPGMNFTPRYRTFNAPTMLPPENVIQSSYTPQMLPHGRAIIPAPYQGIEYVNTMPFGPTTYDTSSLHPSTQLIPPQQTRGPQGMKQEVMFQEPSLSGMSGSGDYSQQAQPFPIYSHH